MKRLLLLLPFLLLGAGPSPCIYSTGGTTRCFPPNGYKFPDNTVQATAANVAINASLTGASPGSVLFVGPGPSFAEDNAQFFWDNTNFRLGIGTATPANPLSIYSSTSDLIRLENPSPTGYNSIRMQASHPFAMGVGNSGTAPYANKFYLIDGGSAIVALDGATGFLGVGTLSPASELEVALTANNNPLLTVNGTASGGGNSYVTSAIKTSTHEYRLGVAETSESFFGLADKFFISDFTGGAIRMTLDTTGNVGIGTTTPGSKLSVAGVVESAIGGFKFPDATTQTTAALAPSIGGPLTSVTTGSVLFGGSGIFAQDNANFFWDDASNRLGLGTTTPATTLDVNGSVTLPTSGILYSSTTKLLHTTGGGHSVFLGQDAGNLTYSGDYSTAVGQHAGLALTSGVGNSFFGGDAGKGVTTGTLNTAIGPAAGQSLTLGGHSIFIGEADTTAATSDYQIAIGNGASSLGSISVAIGHNTRAGGYAVSIGEAAGQSLTSGNYNTIVGGNSGRNISTGDQNTIYGANAGPNVSTGGNNSVLGMSSAPTLTTGDHNVVLGMGADVSAAGASYQTVIGAGAVGTANNTVTLGRATDGVVIPGTGGLSGNVPHACYTASGAAGADTVSCAAGEIATGGGVDCGSTALFVSKSTSTGTPANAWTGSCTSLLNVVTNTTILVRTNCCAY